MIAFFPLLTVMFACAGESDTDLPPPDSDTDVPVDTDVPPVISYNRCTAPEGLRATGNLADPLSVVAPFGDAYNTVGGPSNVIATYDCAPDTDESGPEVVYSLHLDAPARVHAEVVSAQGVDVDVHLLSGLSVRDGVANGCIARGDRRLEQQLPAGDYTVIVDTYVSAGSPHVGPYEVYVTAFPDGQWVDTEVAAGLHWKQLRSVDGELGNQTINVVSLEPSEWDVTPVVHDGCQTVPAVAQARGARVGINAGFFEDCAPYDFVRADGVTEALSTHWERQRLVAWDDGAAPTTAWITGTEDYTAQANAVGSYPSLVTNSAVVLEPPGESDFYLLGHPRSALGIGADGTLEMATVDGRTEHGDGLPLAAFAGLLQGLGWTDATNLDGGGSTTLVLTGCGPGGVINNPSESTGLRAVSDGLYAQPR